MSPRLPLILHSRDAIRLRIEVLPSTPFPNALPIGRHLDEIVPVHLSVMFRARHSPFNLRNEIMRQPSQANQKHVTVAQPYAIVMMIGLANFPKNAPVPVTFE